MEYGPARLGSSRKTALMFPVSAARAACRTYGFGRCDRRHWLLFDHPFIFWTRLKFKNPAAPAVKRASCDASRRQPNRTGRPHTAASARVSGGPLTGFVLQASDPNRAIVRDDREPPEASRHRNAPRAAALSSVLLQDVEFLGRPFPQAGPWRERADAIIAKYDPADEGAEPGAA